MRSPEPAFDLRAALSQEVHAAIDELDASDMEPKAIHRCRVRVKRARALARVGHACAPGLSAVFGDSARAVMQALARARDLAALAEAARDTAKHSKKREAAALMSVADVLDAERSALPSLNVDAVRTGLKDLLALAQVWPEASGRQIKRGSERIVRRARHACKRGRGSGEAVRRHEWRKREKDRLYAALLLGEAWPRKRRRKRGEELGNVLGHERDALLLLDRLEMVPAMAGDTKAAKNAVNALKRRRKALAKRADALGARLHVGGA